MKLYELFYLVSGSIPENELEAIQKEIAEWISGLGGSVKKQEAWGRKKLAYPIQKERNGFYFLHEFELEPALLNDFNKKLKLHSKVLRALITVKVPLSEKALKMQEHAQKRAHVRAAQSHVQEREGKEPTKAAIQEETSKIKLDELDKKLDELLDQDIVK